MALSLASADWRIGSLRKPLASGGGTIPPLPSSNWSKRGPMVPAVPVKPATSTSSVGGNSPWACSRWRIFGSFGGNRVAPSGGGNKKPCELLHGSPEGAEKRACHSGLG